MVERILDAGRAVLLERGYERTSTSRIAKRAGISPGSLYQYFPDKEAILDRVLDEYTERLHARITDAFMKNLGAAGAHGDRDDRGARGERGLVRGTIAGLLDALETDAGLLRALIERRPRDASQRLAEFPKRIDQLVTTALLFQAGGGPVTRPVDAAAWILVRSIESVTVNYVLDPPAISRDTVIDELTDLVTGYLFPAQLRDGSCLLGLHSQCQGALRC